MNTSRKLTISFFIGMIAISVASLSFSIAWYATSSFLTVSPIDIAIKTDIGLKISTTNVKENFKESLSLEDGTLDYSGYFSPVSSISSQEWIYARAQAPIFYDCSRPWSAPGEPVKEVITREDGYYYSQEFYMYADTDVFITLDTSDTYIEADNGKDQEKLDNLVKAMRFSILVTDEDSYAYYIIKPYKPKDPSKEEKDEEVVFGGVLDNSKSLTYDTYTLDGKKYETVYGNVNDRSLIKYDYIKDSIYYTGESSAFNATHEGGTYMFNEAASLDPLNGMEFEKENAIKIKDLEKNPELVKIPVDRGYEHTRKMVISIYIEGWDRHSINSTMGSHFKSNISFKVLRQNPK